MESGRTRARRSLIMRRNFLFRVAKRAVKITALLNQLQPCEILRPTEFFRFKDVIESKRVIGVSRPMSVTAVIQPALLVA